MKKCSIYILLFLGMVNFSVNSFAQFPPRVGILGSDAIHKDSSIILDWASRCTIDRGWVDIGDESMGKVTFGLLEYALDKSDGSAVSLGDGGHVIIYCDSPLENRDGPDFAIFENSFDDYFLELATVEVSSNGIDYFEFPSISNTSTREQKGTFDTLTASNINNLAGKYRVFYGTPFDLEALRDVESLDINSITHIRITDVVGSIDEIFGSLDRENNYINDPFPTPFPSGGFDLDAVAFIHQKSTKSIIVSRSNKWHVSPSLIVAGEDILIFNDDPQIILLDEIILNDAFGQVVSIKSRSSDESIVISTHLLPVGEYFIHLIERNHLKRTILKFVIQ